MTGVFIFAGPSVLAPDIEEFEEFHWLPPVSQGDVFRCSEARPSTIGIIDGYFDGSPAVWHKEILHALSAGIAVFGAASMGALRAAELSVFGMRGVGEIFQNYRNNVLVDDDEVALIHGPAETGYMNVSVAMVDIRATLSRAVVDGCLTRDLADHLAASMKKMHYPKRDWAAVQKELDRLDPERTPAFDSWIKHGKTSQKRADARALLMEVREFLKTGGPQPVAKFEVAQTELWLKGRKAFANEHLSYAGLASDEDRLVIEEVQIRPPLFADVSTSVALAMHAKSMKVEEPEGLEKEFRLENGLVRQAQYDQWLELNALDRDRLGEILTRRHTARNVAARIATAHPDSLIEELKFRGDYGELADRARSKQKALKAMGWFENPTYRHLGLGQSALLDWYFHERLQMDVPKRIEAFAINHGFSSLEQFIAAIAKEQVFFELDLAKS
jgi:hypothetical protein